MSAATVVRTTVLVVDDDALVRSALRMALSRMGYSVVDASDAQMAVSVAAQSHPALVVLDVNLPGGAFHDTLAALRRLDDGVAVLVLSGESSAPPDAQGPLTDFARKPIEFDDLVNRVQRLLIDHARVR